MLLALGGGRAMRERKCGTNNSVAAWKKVLQELCERGSMGRASPRKLELCKIAPT